MYFHSINFSCLEYYIKKWPEFYLLVFFCFLSIRLYSLINKNKLLVRWPVLDSLPSIVLNAHRIHDWTVELSKTIGSTIVARGPIFGRLDILFTCEPCNIRYILSTNFPNFHKGSGFRETLDALGEGLIGAEAHFWFAQRRIARTTLSSKNVRNAIAKVGYKVVRDSLLPLLAHVAKQTSIVDLEDVFLRYAFDTSVSIILGKNPQSLSTCFPSDRFAKAMDDVSEALFYRHVVPSSWWKLSRRLMMFGSNERKLEKAQRTMDQQLTKYITEKREEMARGSSTVDETDLLQVYMSVKLEEEEDEQVSSKMSGDKFLKDTALTFLFGSRDTTGTSLAWFFWLISKNPCVEAKILEELKKVVSSKKRKDDECGGGLRTKRSLLVFDADELTAMVYLHAALCESLRLYPSVPVIRKDAKEDDVLPDGTAVKSGMMIILSPYAMGRMEAVWGKDCLEFKPQRWIDEDGKLNRDTLSKLTSFSLGPRICLGKDIAFLLMKSAASAMLFNFHVQVLEGQNIQPKPSLVLKMKNGLMVRIKERVVLL